MVIRRATIEDVSAILHCIKGLAKHVGQLEMVTATETDLISRLFGSDSNAVVFVAEDDQQDVAGFVLVLKIFSTFKATVNFFIEDLFVFPQYRGNGFGIALFNRVKGFAKQSGAEKVEWYVNNANKGAWAFYQKIGARELDYKSIFYIEV